MSLNPWLAATGRDLYRALQDYKSDDFEHVCSVIGMRQSRSLGDRPIIS
jgi:hypothetical protein